MRRLENNTATNALILRPSKDAARRLRIPGAAWFENLTMRRLENNTATKVLILRFSKDAARRRRILGAAWFETLTTSP